MVLYRQYHFAIIEEPTENSDGTVSNLRPWKPGQSGNPGGRPKGIARTVRERCGGDATKLVEVLLAIAEGRGLNSKPVHETDRIRATELLLAYGWGRPPEFAAIEGADPLEHDEVTEAIVSLVDELSQRREP